MKPNKLLNTHNQKQIQPYREIVKKLLPYDKVNECDVLHPDYYMEYKHNMCLEISEKIIPSEVHEGNEIKYLASYIGRMLSRDILWELYLQGIKIYQCDYIYSNNGFFNIYLYVKSEDVYSRKTAKVIKNVKYNLFEKSRNKNKTPEKSLFTFTSRTEEYLYYIRFFKYKQNYYAIFSEKKIKNIQESFQPGLLLKKAMDKVNGSFFPINCSDDFSGDPMIVETNQSIILVGGNNGYSKPKLIQKSNISRNSHIEYLDIFKLFNDKNNIDKIETITMLNLPVVKINNSEYRALAEYSVFKYCDDTITRNIERIEKITLYKNKYPGGIHIIPMNDNMMLLSEFSYRITKIQSLLHNLSSIPISYLIGRILMDIDNYIYKPTIKCDLINLIKLGYFTGDELISSKSFRKISLKKPNDEELKLEECDFDLTIDSEIWHPTNDYNYSTQDVIKDHYIKPNARLTPETFFTIMGITMKLKDWIKL